MFEINEIIDLIDKDLKDNKNEEFKRYSSLMGIYKERKNNKYMIRYRFTGGIIKPSELRGIANVLKELSYKKIHFTTRQDIQFHHLTGEELKKVVFLCNNIGISSLATGGPAIRNIQLSPLTGVIKDEDYDISPYVLKASKYFLEENTLYTLPKKYKVSISNNQEDTVNAKISDLGIITKVKNGIRGFEVYGAGGLGNSPNVGILLCDFDTSENLIYHILAMRNIFDKYGNREIKAKARVRHILKKVGEVEFKKLYEEEVTNLKKSENLKIVLEDGSYAEVEYEKSYEVGYDVHPLIKFGRYRNLIVKQKQRGYYSVYIHPNLGDISYEYISKITEVISLLGYDVSLRLTNTQGIYIRDIKAPDVERFLRMLPDIYTDDIFSSVSCTGASTCKLGILKSKNLLSDIIETFREEKKSIRRALPRIYISGCPNSCGQHLKGQIGLCGRVKNDKLGLVPYYGIFVDGDLKKPSLAYELGEVPARNIVEFLVELAKLKHVSKIRNFNVFLKEKEDFIKNLINKFSKCDSYNEDFYIDIGDDEKFSLER